MDHQAYETDDDEKKKDSSTIEVNRIGNVQSSDQVKNRNLTVFSSSENKNSNTAEKNKVLDVVETPSHETSMDKLKQNQSVVGFESNKSQESKVRKVSNQKFMSQEEVQNLRNQQIQMQKMSSSQKSQSSGYVKRSPMPKLIKKINKLDPVTEMKRQQRDHIEKTLQKNKNPPVPRFEHPKDNGQIKKPEESTLQLPKKKPRVPVVPEHLRKSQMSHSQE